MATKHYTLHFNQGKCDIVTAIRISSHNFILLSTSWKNPPFSTISETCFHISLQFLKLTFIFSTNSISLRFWELDFTGKYFSTISVTCFHLSTISETYFHLSTISISLQIWTHPFYYVKNTKVLWYYFLIESSVRSAMIWLLTHRIRATSVGLRQGNGFDAEHVPPTRVKSAWRRLNL